MTTTVMPAGLTPVEQTIYQTALTYGVDPRLALADAEVESGLSPTAVGDQGTSFGLYQLHQGGELGSLTPSQAFNPSTNAQVALSVFGAVAAAHPATDPGLIAALAERPANPTAYAAAVDAVYGSSSFLPQVPGGASIGSASSAGATGTSAQTTSSLGGIASALTPGLAIVGDLLGGTGKGIVQSATKGAWEILITIAFVAAGLGLILLGLTRLFPGVTRTVTSTVATATKLAA
jgi:hypothetical protein